jgi:Flp pilus assembly protein TadG
VRRKHSCRARCDEQGSATLEIAVLFPAVLLATFGLIQGALYYHARDVALAAATDGLTAARTRAGSGEEGRQVALAFLGSSVDSVRTATAATVTVTGRTLSLVPGLAGWSVSQTASGPVERFTRAGQP